jgi:flagellar biosynthesis GTPase FlhF
MVRWNGCWSILIVSSLALFALEGITYEQKEEDIKRQDKIRENKAWDDQQWAKEHAYWKWEDAEAEEQSEEAKRIQEQVDSQKREQKRIEDQIWQRKQEERRRNRFNFKFSSHSHNNSLSTQVAIAWMKVTVVDFIISSFCIGTHVIRKYLPIHHRQPFVFKSNIELSCIVCATLWAFLLRRSDNNKSTQRYKRDREDNREEELPYSLQRNPIPCLRY